MIGYALSVRLRSLAYNALRRNKANATADSQPHDNFYLKESGPQTQVKTNTPYRQAKIWLPRFRSLALVNGINTISLLPPIRRYYSSDHAIYRTVILGRSRPPFSQPGFLCAHANLFPQQHPLTVRDRYLSNHSINVHTNRSFLLPMIGIPQRDKTLRAIYGLHTLHFDA